MKDQFIVLEGYTEDQLDILFAGIPRLRRMCLLIQYCFYMSLPIPAFAKIDLIESKAMPKIKAELLKELYR